MSARPVSLMDEPCPSPKIRKDQFKRIGQIVKANRDYPVIALGLVRDYVKGIEEVDLVKFDNETNPTEIQVITKGTKSWFHLEGTRYMYKLSAPQIIEAPTL